MAAPSNENEIYLSSSPHFTAGTTTSRIMLFVIISLLPLCGFGIFLFGIPALVTILTSVASCVLFEYLFQILTKQTVRIKDLSAVVTGILLALVMTPSMGTLANVWKIVLGAFFAIVVAKGMFGGIGANVFNPALIGRAFLFVSFPTSMTTWTDPNGVTDVVTSATSQATEMVDALSSATILSMGSEEIAKLNPLSLFWGFRAGCIGETSIFLILVAFFFLFITKIIDWRAPVAMIATVVIATLIAGGDVIIALLSGGLLFGAVFMVTDYATTPVTQKGRLLFGFGCGLITFLIRQFSGYPEGVMFSILIMNTLVPFLNKLIGKKYGFVKKAKKGGTK